MLRSRPIGKQSGESVESVLKKKATVERICVFVFVDKAKYTLFEKKVAIFGFFVSPCSSEAIVRRCGKIN